MRTTFATALWLVLCTAPIAAQQVIVSEFMASNDRTLKDEDGESSDWIEIHNAGGTAVDLSGWYLTDSATKLTRWAIPAPTTLAAGGYLVVFASGKDRAVAGKQLHTDFGLKAGGEYLGLVWPDGLTVASSFSPVFPVQFTDVSYGYSFNPAPTVAEVYFTAPTPGTSNGVGGSVITNVVNTPAQPKSTEDIVIEAKVVNAPGQSTGLVILGYREGFLPDASRIMVDDGLGIDKVAGDGVYTAMIPRGTPAGAMLRWRVSGTIAGGASVRAPLYLSQTNSAEYFGTMIANPGVTSTLPIFHWFVQNPTAARTSTGARCSVFFDGRFYDNVLVRRRGGSSTGWTKKNFKFDFNSGDHFWFDPSETPVEELNLNSTWSDKTFVRRVLSFETYRDVGSQYSIATPWRVQQNNQFYSVAIFIEQPDEEYLERQGLDSNGALYKMYSTLSRSSGSWQKKTRTWESDSEMRSMISAIHYSGAALENYLFDNIDLPAVLTYMAGAVLIHENDHVHKNYYLYRDNDGDGEWRFLPWDKDLTFGRNYLPRGGGVLNDTIYAAVDPHSHPLLGDKAHPNTDTFYNRLIDACHKVPRIREMFLRRLRTVMDERLQTAATARSQRYYEARIDRLKALMTVDVALDRGRWGIPAYGNRSLDFISALSQLENSYLAPRRTHLFVTHSSSASGIIPAAQLAQPKLEFGRIEDDPASGNQDEEYVEVRNCNGVAVDVSYWRLSGGIDFAFPPGTVIPANDSVFVSPDLRTFRARTSGPSGNQGLLVVGPYVGHLKPTEALVLTDVSGRKVADKGAVGFSLTTRGAGDVDLQVNGVQPMTELYILLSVDTSRPIGCGPVAGLGYDAVGALSQPVGTHPFHVLADANGQYRLQAPAGSLTPGLELDSRVIYVDPIKAALVMSRIVRVRF